MSDSFYNSNAWTIMSKTFKKNYPLCKMCEDRGITKIGIEVDHIIPISIDYDLRLDVENLQTLCKSCHSHKTNRVDRRLKKGLEPMPMRGTNSNGLPTDLNHSWNR